MTGKSAMLSRQLVRLAAPILGLSLLPLAGAVLTAWSVHQTQREVSRTLALNVASMRAAEELTLAVREARSRVEHHLLSGDSASLKDLAVLHNETRAWLMQAERTAVTPREQELIAQIRVGHNRFFTSVTAEGPARLAGPTPDQLPRLLALANDITQSSQKFLDYNEEEIASSSEQNTSMADRMALVLLALGICGPVAGLAAGIGLTRAISRSVVRLSVPIQDAAGKLSEVVGPAILTAGRDLDGLEVVLRCLAEQVGTVVERLQVSQRDALRAEQLAAVGQLAAGIAHELRNPLMSMKILVQSAADRGPSTHLSDRDLRVLEEEINRLERLTHSFLDFARPPRLEKRPFEVRSVLDEAMALVAAQAERRAVRLRCSVPQHPVILCADPGQVRQVLLNLLLNALDAVAEEGSIDIRLETFPRLTPCPTDRASGEELAGEWLVLRVADDGPGLPPALGPEIFLPFVSTKPTGIGLGLSICKRIVEAHQGEITSTNRPGGGAEFVVRMPCCDVARGPGP